MMSSGRIRWAALALFIFLAWIVFAAQKTGGPVPLSIIVVPTEQQARRLVDRLNSGSDFAALAKAESTDPSASDSGYLGVLDPAGLRPELKNAIAGLAPGRLSAIVRIPSGFAILKILPQAPSTTGRTAPLQSLSSAGAVRLTFDYAGFSAALRATEQYPKPPGWDRDLPAVCAARTEAVPAVMEQIQPLLSRPGAPPALLRDANSLLADLHAYRGDFPDAIAHWEAAYKTVLESSPERAPQYEESLGAAYLQKAGLSLYPKYIFPESLHEPILQAHQNDLAQARQYFVRYLKRVPEDGEVRWLLNLTYMLSGDYPAKVPKQYLIDPAVFESTQTVGRFTSSAAAAGLSRTGQAGGVAIDDFDNDGNLDVMVSSVNDCEPLAFFHNNGDGTFTNRAEATGLLAQTGGLNIIQTDYNNDGCKDLLVLRGGWEYPRRKSLLRNNCNGTFTDVTKASGLMEPVTATQTAVWTDIDNDGWLDLFIGNENAPAQLFLNKRDGTFEDIAASAGVNRTGFSKGVIAADYDNDGYPDLYVSALNGDHHLYRNNHNKTFTDVTREAGVEGPRTSFGAWFFDYNNDGLPDLFVAGYGVSVEDVMNGYLKRPQGGEALRLFRNMGNGKFTDVTREVGLNRVFMPMGLNFGDIDNDGYPDFYLGSGNPSYASPIPNVLFHNIEGRRFVDVTASSGTGALAKGHGIAFADLDNDGDQDIYAVLGGAVPGDRQASRLFENPGNGNDWLSLRLEGSKTNRAALGARIQVTVRDGSAAPRSIYATVGSGGSFGASPFEQHLGLGKSANIDTLEIWWPASGTRQTFRLVAKNQAVEIHEFSKEYRTLVRPLVRFGGTANGKNRQINN